MKASVYTHYGSPDILQIKEVEIPVPKEDEVLVRVYASTVNRSDCAMLRARPFFMRFFTGLLKPRKPILGTDFAGSVVGVGKDVTTFKTGDRIFGFDDMGVRSHAEFLAISVSKAISVIPEKTTFEEAAASIEGAHYAYNFINKIDLKPTHQVLVNGATGAIGSAAVQLVKYVGAHVTAVCNTKNVALIKSLGADEVIDYLKEDFTQAGKSYDFIFDAVGKSSFGKCKPLLKAGGVYISSELGWMAQNIFFALIKPLTGNRKVIFPIPSDIKESIRFVKKLIEEDKFKPVIDRVFSLEEVAEAFRYVETGNKTGNVIVTLE